MRDNSATPIDSAEAEVEELAHLLWQKKYRLSPARRRRLKTMGRLVEVPGLEPPGSTPATIPLSSRSNGRQEAQGRTGDRQESGSWRPSWRAVGDRTLLLAEVALLLFFFFTAGSLWLTNNALNRELATAQKEAGSALALPTPRPGPSLK